MKNSLPRGRTVFIDYLCHRPFMALRITAIENALVRFGAPTVDDYTSPERLIFAILDQHM